MILHLFHTSTIMRLVGGCTFYWTTCGVGTCCYSPEMAGDLLTINMRCPFKEQDKKWYTKVVN